MVSEDFGSEICHRCEDGEAYAEFTHSALEGAQTNRHVICKDCVVSLGEWFRGAEESRGDE